MGHLNVSQSGSCFPIAPMGGHEPRDVATYCLICLVCGIDRADSAAQAPAMKVRELLRLLEGDGWHLVRTRGSHRQFRHSTKPGTVTVSGNAGVDVPRGTLRAILKQARIQPLRNVNAIRGRD